MKKLKTKIYAVVAMVLLLLPAQAQIQYPRLNWVKALEGGASNKGQSIAVDAAGNVYTAGSFWNICDFDPGPGVFNLGAISGENTFISKLDANGNFLWAKVLDGKLAETGASISTDPAGNVYLTGSFNETVDFDLGNGTFELTATGLVGNYNPFILKLNTNGDFVWVKQLKGSKSGFGVALTVDAASNVYAIGRFEETVDFDPGNNAFELTSTGYSDTYILKLDGNGNFIWAKKIGCSIEILGKSIAVDLAGNVYTTGAFMGTADLDPGQGTEEFISLDEHYDIFISKLDMDGNFVWAKHIGGDYPDEAKGISVDVAGNVYTTGYFAASVDFDPGPDVFELHSPNAVSMFASKLDTDGNFIWATAGEPKSIGWDIAVDILGKVYVAGQIQNIQNTDGQVYKFDIDGDSTWQVRFAGVYDNVVNAIAVDEAGFVYTTGKYQGTTDFDPGNEVLELATTGASDIFIHKMTQDVVSVNENTLPNSITMYPNPTSDLVSLVDLSEGSLLSMIDMTGKIIYSARSVNGQMTINTTDFVNGIYFVQIEQNGRIANEKLIVTK